jgi:DNA-binding NtrC family response regulator
VLATLRHTSLPWSDRIEEVVLDAEPLVEVAELGPRDRLSLLAQFAAHAAFLQFAGVVDGELDPAAWLVVRKRGTDCRLIRRAAAACDVADSPPALSLVQQFADAIGGNVSATMDSLKRSWGRAESVYDEIHARLAGDAAADLRWMRAAATGRVAAPSAAQLRSLSPGTRLLYDDDDAIATLQNVAGLDATLQVIVLGSSGFALHRYAAFAELDTVPGIGGAALERLSASELAELVRQASLTRHLLFATRPDSLHERDGVLLRELFALPDISWLLHGSARTLVDATRELPHAGESQLFLIAPSLALARELEQRSAGLPPRERRAWYASFTASTAFDRWLRQRQLPSIAAPLALPLPEPQRSYVATLALIAERIDRAHAVTFLERLRFTDSLESLAIEHIVNITSESVSFGSENIRAQIAAAIPLASRPELLRTAASAAATHGATILAARLLRDAGDDLEAVRLLGEQPATVEELAADALIELLAPLSRIALARAPRIAAILGNALIASCRYRDARELAPLLSAHDAELLLARCERREGDYATARARLERMTDRPFAAEHLLAELLLLDGEFDPALRSIDVLEATASSPPEMLRTRYARALHSIECGSAIDAVLLATDDPLSVYFSARIDTYRALAAGENQAACALSRRAILAASTKADAIDARLDLVEALFVGGQWAEARLEALDALKEVEETQGDRAAAGLLLTLAYLSADDGRWREAEQRIARLEHYYGATHDAMRLQEVALLSAQLDFCRGRFDDARERASSVITCRGGNSQIRAAACLILDEIDWLAGDDTPLRANMSIGNVELSDRAALLRARRGEAVTITSSFSASLLAWECSVRDGAAAQPPIAESRSDQLKLFRAAAGWGRALNDQALLKFAGALAESCDVTWQPIAAPSQRRDGPDVLFLRAAAMAAFPFSADAFGAQSWSLATRNRLGQWQQIGSSERLDARELDRISSAGAVDWTSCGERELLYVEAMQSWTAVARDAVRAMVRTRSEHHRFRRIVEQEDAAREESGGDAVDGIVGVAPAMREIFSRIARVARRDVAVCVLGESGTGKELIARAIHRQSPRKSKPFTAINCAALPETLIESELFGHARGAFTGADRDRAGLIESSEGGTLFLDEIGEMPLGAQAKLLRFLQEGEFRRVGDTLNRTADVRIVSATNRKLELSVEEGSFREDLYYRIRGVELALPSLRERGSDVLLLARHFLQDERTRHRGGAGSFSDDVESLLTTYAWPGNVRELQNTIRAAHAMAGEARQIALEHLPERMRRHDQPRMPIDSYHEAVIRFRRELIERSLTQSHGNQSRAATMLKMSRQALSYQIRELGILVHGRREQPEP